MDSTNSIQRSSAADIPSPSSYHSGDEISVATVETSVGNSQQASDDAKGNSTGTMSVRTQAPRVPKFKSLKAIEKETIGKCLSEQSYRIFRRTHLTRRAKVSRQILLGRGDPSKTWCNDQDCYEEAHILMNPTVYLINFQESHVGIPVEDYLKEFADAMATKLFGIQDVKVKHHKVRGLLSFIDSPPVRGAFWRFIGNYEMREFDLSDEEFQEALEEARPVFQDIMFGVKTSTRIQTAHSYINPEDTVLDGWSLEQFILRFLICCEMWRQQKTPRSESWKIGSSEGVAQFLTAMLFNYKLMWREDCLEDDIIYTNKEWDQVWEGWLSKYPLEDLDQVIDGEVFQTRDSIEKSEDEVLEEVGYLGGVGVRDECYKPAQWSLGKQGNIIMM
ncbi:hypothetical protein F66182_5630 [Fusarium sp. NRRL 66182]|nr:hypothetical protein F66182_5630 [Fusarium sp. NRRL 66182]